MPKENSGTDTESNFDRLDWPTLFQKKSVNRYPEGLGNLLDIVDGNISRLSLDMRDECPV